MKKVSREQRLRFWRASRNEIRRRNLNNDRRKREKRQRQSYTIIAAPQVFSLMHDNRRKRVITFVRRIHRYVKAGERKIWLDFSQTKKVVADGMIYVYAEISRLLEVVEGLNIKSTAPVDPTVGQVFNQLRFSKLIGVKIKKTTECQRKDVSTWLYASGQGVVGEKCENLLDHYDGRIAPSLSRELFKGMTEAMTNAHHHAYMKERGDSLIHVDRYKPWWLFSQELEGVLNVVFCDLGMGIPKTLPINKPGLMSRLIKMLGKDVADSKTIEEAVQESRTRTHMAHRGKGLKQVVETIGNSEDGEVFIFSNKGCYNRKADGSLRTKDFSSSIRGTIVSWKMEIPGVEEKVPKSISSNEECSSVNELEKAS